MKVEIDRTKCDGYANCLMEAERVFDIDDGTGQAVLLMAEIPAELDDDVRRAAASCPAGAILVEG